ncbi:MAG TPA: DUF167 domain-containing protein [Candidatus Paceibacterota bacterium]
MYVRVHVLPGSRRESFLKESNDTFIACVKEEAKRNQANKRVRELLGAYYNLPLGRVALVSGHRSPHKVFTIEEEA